MSAAGGRSERAEDEARGVTLGIGGGFEPGRVDAPPAGISGRRGESGRGNSLLELGDCDAHVETTSDATARPGTLRGMAGAARGEITSQNREISLCRCQRVLPSTAPVGICEMWKVWFVDQKRESPTRRRAFSPGRPAPATIERRGMPISRSRALIAFRGVCCSRTPGALAYTLCICVFVYLLISILRFAILPVFLTESQRARIINLNFPFCLFSVVTSRAHLAWGAK